MTTLNNATGFTDPGNEENDPVNQPGDTGATGENDITTEELDLLDKAGVNESADDDDEKLAKMQLDDEDADGEKLNEALDLTGNDLDVPGSESDDTDEDLGEEDEENNSYSISDQDNS